MKMLGKKMESVKKLAKKVKVIGSNKGISQPLDYECLLCDCDESPSSSSSSSSSSTSSSSACNNSSTPTGFFAIYVGEERQRFVVPTSYLSHPVFRMLLEKAYDEFGFQQKNGLVLPCSVSTFQEAVSAVECCHGQFDLGWLVKEFA
ncbi:hypothetical protein Syun_002523 [Stephania yunnanensis]|uniref:Uncharacterized protein n=1 Tax=Stephania yunnanensis TaxID=152371 RepID=A0AAP0LFK6_9MAGN